MDSLSKQKRIVVGTNTEKFPLPNISDLFDQLVKCRNFTSLNLVSCFDQKRFTTKTFKKIVFIIENGPYEFVHMLFELRMPDPSNE